MHYWIGLALLLAAPFWETKAPREWDDEQLLQMLTDSPWAYSTKFRDGNTVPVYLAAAKPMREAEAEERRRYAKRNPLLPEPEGTARQEFEAFLAENEGKVIVLALRPPNGQALLEQAEIRKMEEESVLKVGKQKYKVTGHFPPGANDPALRLVFPRPENLGKELKFELYLPGATPPYRDATFSVKELVYHGKPEL